jgi:hypothetical protein
MTNDYFVIQQVGDVVRLTRTTLPMPAKAEEIREVYDAAGRALNQYAGLKVLVDLRGGPVGRNDDAFEAVSSEATRRMVERFTKVAVLVKSAAGKLQIKRLSSSRAVFRDEAEALAYLAAG